MKVESIVRTFLTEKKRVKQSGGGKENMQLSKQKFKQDILNLLNSEQQNKFLANIQTYKDLLKN